MNETQLSATRNPLRRARLVLVATVAVIALGAVGASVAFGSAPSGVTPILLARGTYGDFKVASRPDGGGMFKAEAKGPIDVVVRRHEYGPGGHTGWHAHPYPVLITVIQGTLTFYEYDDGACTPIVVHTGEGYVDSGSGHIARNETEQPAVDISVIMAPVGGAFRTELDAPAPACGF